jgi:hypothetical protein
MSNYKGMKFPNTLTGFKSWCREFRHMCHSDVRVTDYYQHGNYYLECNKVVIRELSGKPFLGTSLRGYTEKDQDFGEHYLTEEEADILRLYFSERVEEFCRKNGIVKH